MIDVINKCKSLFDESDKKFTNCKFETELKRDKIHNHVVDKYFQSNDEETL